MTHYVSSENRPFIDVPQESEPTQQRDECRVARRCASSSIQTSSSHSLTTHGSPSRKS